MQTGKVSTSILVICLILTGFSFLAGCTQKGPDAGVVKSDAMVVKTDAGSVSGLRQDGLRVFHGIPFAAPPTGDLRWRPPAPVKPWDGVKDTKEYSATCPQPGSPAPLNMSEDCLYLNVWTPAQSADEKLPVMVFFFGGGFKDVAFNMPTYNGTTLAQKGVIVVTPNYRLGALGFLAHPQLDNESPHNASGNYGIMDQQAALSWVQHNIDKFGGDPSRVTIFGQSAGAESVLVHVASPTSKGLFQQGIVESGPFWAHGAIIDATHPKAYAEQFGVEYATSLGYSGPDAIAEMRHLSPEVLINATPSPSPGFWTTHTVQFEPTIDGWILPDSMDNQYLLHKQNPVPLMIGNNANDGTTLSANANMTVPEYVSFLKSRFGNDTDKVLAKYPANSTAEVQLRLGQIMTDYDFSDSVKFAAGSMGDISPDTYVYRYSYILPGQSNGAFHGSETLLLFGVPVPADPAVASNVVDLWTRFAKTGNPNGGMSVTWPNYTRELGRYLDINQTPTVKSGGYTINSTVHTTLDRTIIPVPVPSASPKLLPYQVANFSEYGYGVWRYGDGLGYEKRLDLMPPGYAPAPVTTPARLLNFFTMTDIHITDKESPAQAVYYGYGWGMISGYSPAMLTTTQVLDAAVQTVNALNREKPFDFGIFLGDAINSGQHNELRWYIDVLDGRTIKPDSGVMDDPVPGPLNDYQDDYKAAGLDPAIPWYQVLGNHDHFWMGLFVPDDHIRSSLTGNAILNIGNVLTDKLRVNSRGFYVGAIDGRTPYGDITGAGPVSDFPRGPPTVPADPDRRFLSRTEWIGEFFNSSSAPAGHGFDRSDVTTGFACYSFDPRSDLPIRVIVLDDTQDDNNPVDGSSSGHGSLDKERYDWLVKELDKGQAEGRLMIIAAHIPVGVELESSGLGSLLTWDKYAAVSDTDLVSKLHTYPNLILWVSGHRHLNTVTALKSPDPSRPELGFWEVETASLREFPQQFRTFEIVQNSDNTISIFATDVDPSVSDGSPAAGSRSYAIAAYQTFRSGADSHPVGSYNAELVKQLSPEMQVKIQKYGTPAAAGSLRSSTLPGPAPRNPSPTAKSFAVSTTPTGSGDWKFVVFGDSPDPVANTTTGVSPNLSPIAKAIATEKPDLALYIGDLVNGADLTNASPMQNNFTGQFANWEQAVTPIHNYTVNTGIPLYVIRGNHEDGLDKTNAALLDAYRTIVASGMPANGPPGEEKLTYSFTHKGAKFILNDNYIAHNGKKETVNQSWVDGQLAQDTRPFMFVLGHSPAYLVDNDTEDIPFSLPTRPAERDTFWNSMVKSNVSAYFCGHAHLYVRAESQGLPQIVVGNGGAPMQGFDPALANPALTLNYPLKPIAQNDQQVGYLVITLHEDTRTFNGVQKVLNPVTGAWETGDTFTLRAR